MEEPMTVTEVQKLPLSDIPCKDVWSGLQPGRGNRETAPPEVFKNMFCC